MSSLAKELVFLILQFLDEEKFKETVHKLEQESGFFFNMKYFEDQVLAGEWDEVERYLCGFTKVDDNRYSMKIFFEIRKLKYLDALDRNDRAKAVEILSKDLREFASFDELFKEITQLLALNNFRENEQLSMYGDAKSARSVMLIELKKLIEANPLFRDKLTFPTFKASRLRTLINQSLNWQHQLCKNPRPNPDIKTLFTDHSCAPSHGAHGRRPSNSHLGGPIPKAGPYPSIGVPSPFQPVLSVSTTALAGWRTSANPPMLHAAVAAGSPGLVPPPNTVVLLKRPTTPPGMEYQPADSEHLNKQIHTGQSDEVAFSGVAHPPNSYSKDDLPKTVVRILNQGSNVMSFDFHPQQQTLLLVGTNVGDIGLWEVGSQEKIAHRTFKVWDISACSMPFKAALMKDASISVNRCLWSPDGSIVGVAFSKNIVQTYAFLPNGDLRSQLEIDAHVGGVNDIAFCHPNKSLTILHAVMTRESRFGMLQLEKGSISLKVMKLLFTVSVLNIRHIYSSFSPPLLMEKLRHGSMIAWDLELIMMPQDSGVRQWHTMEIEPGYFLVGQAEKVSPTLLSGMRPKVPLEGNILVLGSVLWVLFSLTQQGTTF